MISTFRVTLPPDDAERNRLIGILASLEEDYPGEVHVFDALVIQVSSPKAREAVSGSLQFNAILNNVIKASRPDAAIIGPCSELSQ